LACAHWGRAPGGAGKSRDYRAAAADRSDGTNEVGYGRTPKHTRFQKGQSSNPGGRRKGQPSIQELILREVARLVKIKIGDKIETTTQFEALVRRLWALAIQGDLGAARLILPFMASAPADAGDNENPDEAMLQSLPAKPDEDMLRRMLARYQDLWNRGFRHLIAGESIATSTTDNLKMRRFNEALLHLYDGFVQLPNSMSGLDALFAEMAAFPDGKHDDQVDALCTVAAYLLKVVDEICRKGRQNGRLIALVAPATPTPSKSRDQELFERRHGRQAR